MINIANQHDLALYNIVMSDCWFMAMIRANANIIDTLELKYEFNLRQYNLLIKHLRNEKDIYL